MTGARPDRLPEDVRERIERSRSRAETLLEEARSLLRTQLPGKLAFEVPERPPEELLTSTERAQTIALVQRYAQLADPPEVELGRRPDQHYIANLTALRQLLSDYRPFLHGSGSPLHYTRLHTAWSRRLSGDETLTVRVLDDSGTDVTAGYRRWLNDRKKAIAYVVGELDYAYVYDGVLLPEKERHAERFLHEYESGELNHTLWVHVVPLGFIRQMLWPYQRLARAVPVPEMGGL